MKLSKIHSYADIFNKVGIPIIVVILSITLPQWWTSQQRKTKMDLEALKIFYQDICGDNPRRQEMALGLLKILNTNLAKKLITFLAKLEPSRAVKLSEIIATDSLEPDYIRSEAERIRYSLLDKFKITSPSDGENVRLFNPIQGNTPFIEMNHYIIVTPLKTGDDFIQDVPVTVLSDGSWSGRAKFGTVDVGEGEKFAVRILSTKTVLPPGPLIDVPNDALSSNSITVIRTK